MTYLDAAYFDLVARRTFLGFPAAFRVMAESVLIRVADWPSDEMLDELEIEDAYELTGLYEGVPLPEKSFDFPEISPDVIWLFREPILAEWEERGDVELDDLIAHVTIHEFAHHFGWSDDEIARVAPWMD